MRPDELARARFGTAELVAEHTPELRDARKRLLLELAWPPRYRPGGELEVTRWRARELSAAPGPGRAPEVELRPGFFTDERVGEWHVNFADTHLFGFYGGPLMAQDELQVAEHPTKFLPDYLLLHPMGMDYHGETFGSDTKEYRNHATHQDSKLAPLLMEWRERGYTIFVTGDHGINADGNHGGTTPEQREVPFYVIQPSARGRVDTGHVISHLQIAPTVLSLLNIRIPSTMKREPLTLD